MSRLPRIDLLQTLSAQLQHFDHSPDLGDGEAVAAIRKHLQLRIRETEGALGLRGQAGPEGATRIKLRSEAA